VYVWVLAWQALGAQACGVNIVQDCVGLGNVAQRKGDPACLYLCHGMLCVPAQQRSCRAGGSGQRNGAPARLWRPGGCVAWWILGLKGLSQGSPVGLRGGSLG
jgi:hypothetical protein